MSEEPSFLFACCQRGAETALKSEVAQNWPEFRFAYSRPGFVTFKLPDGHALAEDFDLRSTFARCYGFSLGKLQGTDAESLAEDVWGLAGERAYKRLHVWQRDTAQPGEQGFEPGPTTLADEVGQILAERSPRAVLAEAAEEQEDETTDSVAPEINDAGISVNRPAYRDQLVLDCVLVEPNEWWIGYHRAASHTSRWPGGVRTVGVPEHAVSRAYGKTDEALRWSRLPIERGDLCVELGSAPGGSCQALLDRGLRVIGIDPAEMDPAVLEHPRFTHLRKRTAEVRRRELRNVKWLTSDMIVAPTYTLDAVESIVAHPATNVRGMLLTLKLLDWRLAEELGSYISRIRGWGFEYVRARQLARNRQEVCVMATRHRGLRRQRPRKRSTDS